MAAVVPLTARHLGRATLARQGLLEPVRASDASEIVDRVVSLQGQHPEWPPVAVASRATDARGADLGTALNRRAVVRSSLMRITIHVVMAADLWPMVAIMRPLRLAQWSLFTKSDPVTSALGRRLHAAHAAAIAALRERPRSSLEIDRLLNAEAGLDPDQVTRPAWREPQRRVAARIAWRHFAATVPLVHVPHAAEGYGRSLYALATDWLGVEPPAMPEDAARAHVARRYLAAFGPASVEDLVAYVGRGKGGIGVWRAAVSALGDEVVTLEADDGRRLVDLANAPRPDPDTPAPPRLLARWDSALLSHEPKRRTRIIADEHRDRVFTKNADVRPSFLVDGTVTGTWSLERSEGTASVRLEPFGRLPRGTRDALVAEAERLLGLLAPNAERRMVDVSSR